MQNPFRRWLSRGKGRGSANRTAPQRKRSLPLSFETLEHRQLLAVNVVDDFFSVRQGEGAVRLDVLANDQISPDHAGTVLVQSTGTASKGGQLQIIEDGAAVSYLAPSHFHGEETFTYSVAEGQFAKVTVTVESPVRDDAFDIVPGSGALTLDVLANDPFWDDYSGNREITQVGRSALGAQLEIAPDGRSLVYTPMPHAYGTDRVDYIVDGVHPATINIQVEELLTSDRDHVLKNGNETRFDVLSNDFAATGANGVGYTGARLITRVLDVPEGASARISSDGSAVLFRPAEGFAGVVNLRYVVDNTFEQTLSISVIDPVRNDWVNVDVDSRDAELDLLSNDRYYFGQQYDIVDKITSVGEASEGGVVALSQDGLSVRYTAPAGFEGTDQFTYVADGKYEAVVFVQVTQPVRDDRVTIVSGSVAVPVPVLENDFLGEGYSGARRITDLEANGALGSFSIGPEGDEIIVTPAAGFVGWESIVYEVDEKYSATLMVHVSNPVENVREYVDTRDTIELSPLTQVDFGAWYAGAKRITSVTQPDNGGSVSISQDGRRLIVQPGVGATSFAYTVDGNEGLTRTARILPAPWTSNDSFVVDQNSELIMGVGENDFQLDQQLRNLGFDAYFGQKRITEIRNVDSGASVSIRPDGKSVHYVPAEDFLGTDTFTYVVDGLFTGEVTVHVVRRVQDDVFRVAPGSDSNVLPVMVNDLMGADYQGPGLITAVQSDNPDAVVSIAEDLRHLVYTPGDTAGAATDTLTYRVDDKFVATVEVAIRSTGTTAHPQFDSIEAMGEYAISSSVEHYYRRALTHPLEGDIVVSFATDSGRSGLKYSDTNTQVSGVDEADLIENDGQFLYSLAGHELVITEVAEATMLEVVSQTALEGEPVGIYLEGNRLTVLSEFWDPEYQGIAGAFVRPPSTTLVSVYDVSDRAQPALAYTTWLDGRYVESRRVDDTVFVVTDPGEILLPAPEFIELEGGEQRRETEAEYTERMREQLESLLFETLPDYATYGPDGEVIRTGLLVTPEDIFQPVTEDAVAFTIVSSLDMGSNTAGLLSSEGVLSGYGTKIHASHSALYVFAESVVPVENRDATDILKFAWDADTGSVRFVASGEVPGYLNDQFSVDEFRGHLRIATSVSNSGSGNYSGSDENALFVLRANEGVLESVGSFHNLALGETIESVRFHGDRALVVTYRKTDPVFALDLSDPTAPYVVGALALPGFSSYMQFIDDDHILTVGQDANGWIAATAVSLIDISQMDRPRLVDQIDFPRGAATLAEADHHAFGWFSHHSLLSLPSVRRYSVREDIDGDGYAEATVSRTEHEQFTFRVDLQAESPLSLHDTIVEDSPIQRSAFVNDTLYAIATDSIQSRSISNPDASGSRVEWVSRVALPGESVSLAQMPENWRDVANTAIASMASQLAVPANAITRVTSEKGSVVLRAGDRQFLYRGNQSTEVELVDDTFEFRDTVSYRHNEQMALDVNQDGLITPLDALITINHLNNPLKVSVRSVEPVVSQWFVDTTGDGQLVPLDALQIVNHLNTPSAAASSQAASAHASGVSSSLGCWVSDDDDEEESAT